VLSAAARWLSTAKIMRMSNRSVENVFLRLRRPETDVNLSAQDAAATPAHDRPRRAVSAIIGLERSLSIWKEVHQIRLTFARYLSSIRFA
jgi:hypothetical protein